MNDMLERVDDAAQRQRRFVADASHELRSPLTRIRTELEVDLAHPDQADLLATHASVLDETIGLQRLADDLLLVARADEGDVGEPRREPVDLDDIVLRVARRLRADDRVRVDLTGVGAGRVVGDPDLLARLVGNLADNAVRHAPSAVDLRSGRATTARSCSPSHDDGPGVPAAERERIFERFARVDGARSPSTGGTGLGLAIARDIAEQHGGTLVLDPTATGARFVLTLPAAAQLTHRGCRRARSGGELARVMWVRAFTHFSVSWAPWSIHSPSITNVGTAVMPLLVGLGPLGVHEVGLGVGREQRRRRRRRRDRRRRRAPPARRGRRRRARR